MRWLNNEPVSLFIQYTLVVNELYFKKELSRRNRTRPTLLTLFIISSF